MGFSPFFCLALSLSLHPHALRRLRGGLRGSCPDAEEEDGIDAGAPVGGSGGALLLKGDIDGATLLVVVVSIEFVSFFPEGGRSFSSRLDRRRGEARARVPPQRRNLPGERVGKGVCGEVRVGWLGEAS